MRWDFYGRFGGEEWCAPVVLVVMGSDILMQVAARKVGHYPVGDRVTQPRYLNAEALRRVRAGMRTDNRMPSWMLADVLQENRIPEWMCEVVRDADLRWLGSAKTSAVMY